LDFITEKLINNYYIQRTDTRYDYHYHHSGDDLDVPGSDLDDEQERIGNEDEENNYYSLGGDDHNELEENNEN
jgi:hypothetical protein